jgi:predicted MFS family arabinose efflux permease
MAALQNPHYLSLWTGAFLSSLGTWTQDVALAWLIHTRFQNPMYLGLRSFAAEAPLIAFMLVGGAAADRFDRRRILLTSNCLQMTFAGVLAALYYTDRLGLAFILLLAFLTGLTQSQSAPTYQAVLTTIVPPAQIPNAVALNSLQFNLSRTIGPVLAGLLLVHAGAGACFTANVVSFLAVIIALLRIRLPPSAKPQEGLRQSMASGFRYVLDTPLLRTLTLVSAAASFLTYPLITYLPVFADDVLRSGATGYSALLSSFGVGAIAGALTTAHRGHVPGRGRIVLRAWLVYGLATLGAFWGAQQWLAMVLLAVSGFCLVTSSSTLISLVQEKAPDHLRGRTLSIYGVAFRGGMPLGSVTAGALVKALGVVAAMSILTAALLLLAVALYWRGDRLRDL